MKYTPSYFEWAEEKTFYSPLYAMGAAPIAPGTFDIIEAPADTFTDTGMEVAPMTEKEFKTEVPQWFRDTYNKFLETS